MSIKSQLEALIYAAEDPITLDQMAALLKDDLLALKTAPEPAPMAAQHAAADEAGQPSQPQPENAEDHLGAVEDTTVQASVRSPEPRAKKTKDKSEKVELRGLLKPFLDELIADYAKEDHGIEIREVASGYRMSTKPEHHDVVRAFSKSLKPPIRLSLQALETLAVIAYKQPVTVPEISDIRGVDAAGVIGTLLERKLITTAGRKAVVGRPMLYKTTKDFLMRFGLRDLSELPSLEEFEKLAAGEMQDELFGAGEGAIPDATGTSGEDGGMEQMEEDKMDVPENVTEPTVSSDPEHDKADEQVAGQIASESSGG
ncbi:MAG TPA: SMC-Scp complex subunit ScpB [Candidatus Angelobacter sp.]|jgi:segregation and condensation protein B|nr:SMC-Scp complex subunit ScpB [Candidatus Angelobacter sp.]